MRFRQGSFPGLFLPYQLCSCGLGRSLVCLASQNSLFKPGYKQLLQTEALSLTTSLFFPLSLPRKSKTAAQERDGKEKEGGDLICLAQKLPQLQNAPFLLPAPYTPPEGSRGWN